MKEKLFEPLSAIFDSKQTKSHESFLKTAENSEFFRMDRTELSSVVNLVQDFSGLRDVRRQLKKFGIHHQTPAKDFYIFRYIAAIGTLGNIEDHLDTALSELRRKELLRQRAKTIESFLTLEKVLQSRYKNKIVLPQGLRWLTLSRQEMEDAKKYAESMYKEKKSSQKQAQYALDSDHTSIPPLSDELRYKILESLNFLSNSMINTLNGNGEELEDLLDQLRKPLTNISKKQSDSELSRFIIEWMVDKTFEKPLKYSERARDILFRLGLIFDNPYAVIYALEYILAIGTIQAFKKEEDDYSFLSDDEKLQIRQEVEEAFRTHPEAYTTHL